MANEEQLKILWKGVNAWNEWRDQNPDIVIDLVRTHLVNARLNGADLHDVDLSDANLTGADFIGADLSGADFRQADLSLANLSKAILKDAIFLRTEFSATDLTKADLRNADLRAANIHQVDFSQADLSGADLSYANLTGSVFNETKFSGIIFDGTVFGFNDLSKVKDIESATHQGPSILGIETIYESKGKTPEVFLRGCGLSDLQIEMAKLAAPGLDPEQVTDITYKIHQLYLGDGIQYYSCFISYSSKDEEFAKHLQDDLQDNGVRCWFAPEDMKIGDPIRPTIDRQIRLRDKLLVILSENSVKSEWVGDEVEDALEEEQKNNRLVLFPIRLDDAVMNAREDWAAKIKRRRHIGDFSNWQDKISYQKAFKRLLRDLKATGGQVNGK